MPLIRAGGRQVHIQEMGDAGPRLVLVHPLGDTLSAWYFTVAPLLATDFRILLYDLRGHGLTELADDGYDLTTLAGDLRDVIDWWTGGSDEPIRVGGHSVGATIALRFSVEHGDLLHSLAVVDAPMPPYATRENPVLGDTDPDEALEAFPTEEIPVRRGRRRRTKALNRKIRLRQETTFTDDFERERGFIDALEVMERPTLLIYGDHSPFLSVGRRLAERLPVARLDVIEGDHMLPLRRRNRVAEGLRTFFS